MRKSPIAVALALATSIFSANTVASDTYTESLSKLRANPDNYTWLQERSIENIDFVNMVLCFVKAAGADLVSVVDKGAYLAEVNDSLCEKGSSATATTSDGQQITQVTYSQMIVDSRTEGGNLDVRLWGLPNPDDEQPGYLRARISIPLNSDSAVPFNRLDYEDVPPDNNGNPLETRRQGYGFLQVNRTGDSYQILNAQAWYEDPSQWVANSNDRSTEDRELTWSNLTRSGSGNNVTLSGWSSGLVWGGQSPVQYQFSVAANASEFKRKYRSYTNGAWSQWSADACFNRTDFKFNTWNYTLYDKGTGSEVSLRTNYSIRYGERSTGRGSYGKWGVWLPDAEMQAMLTAAANSSSNAVGVTVFDDWSSREGRQGTMSVRNGRLRKVTTIRSTLGNLAGVPFDAWLQIKTNGSCNVAGASKKLVWSSQSGTFMDVTSNPAGAAVALGDICNWSLWLNASGLGYEVRPPISPQSGQPDWTQVNGDTVVSTRRESPLTTSEESSLDGSRLVCLTGCQIPSNGDFSYVYADGNQGRSGVEYVFSGGKLYLSSDTNRALPIEYTGYRRWTNECGTQNKPACPKQLGMQHLVSDSLASVQTAANAACGPNTQAGQLCPWKWANEVDTYYSWSSGEDSWGKDFQLSINGSRVTLDDEILVEYTCPSGMSGCTAGQKFALNYGGPKSLWGMPSKCVDPLNLNREVACDSGDVQWMNTFNLTASPISGSFGGSQVTVFDRTTSPAKEYLVLPQGSSEWYGVKNGACTVSLPSDNLVDVNLDDPTTGFQASRLSDMTTIPINTTTATPRVRDGVLLQ